MKIQSKKFIVFASIYPFAVYILFFFWVFFSGRASTGETTGGYIFLIGFAMVPVLTGLALLVLLFNLITKGRRSVTLFSQQIIWLFILCTVTWWTLQIAYGENLEQLPFKLRAGHW